MGFNKQLMFDLEAAEDAGDEKKADEIREMIRNYNEKLAQAFRKDPPDPKAP